jgi:YD repeat-containing protein
MPAKKRTPAELPSEDLVLAAINRAYRHRNYCKTPGVGFALIKDHLGLPRDGSVTRRLHPTWSALEDAGLIEQFRHRSATVWNLTPVGHRRLTAARKTSDLTLPEAPQHQRWRYARTEAGKRIGEFRADLRLLLAQATHLVDAELPAPSDEWYEMDSQLHTAVCRLGSATYCLSEWPEPDDATADKTPEGQVERRNYHAWATST